jgi:hypothetical protein
MAMWEPLIMSYINSQIEGGYQLPVPDIIRDYIDDQRVTTHDQYILLEFKPNFNPDIQVNLEQ